MTPFWQHCRADTDLGDIAPLVEFYRENGPSALARYLIPSRHMSFGIEGYLVMLTGNRVPHDGRHEATAVERQTWDKLREGFAAQAEAGMDVREALACIRHPGWRWHE